MMSFFKHIVFCLLIVLIAAWLLDIIYTASFNTGFSRNKTQYAVQLKNTHIDYVFLGSSRVENNIDCELVTKLTGKSCLNLGIQGSKINDSAALLQLLVDNNVTYENVLFQLDYTVNLNGNAPAFLSSIAPYENTGMLSLQFEKQLKNPIKNTIPFVRYARNDKIIGLREVVLQFAEKSPKTDLTNGFLGIDRIGNTVKGDLPLKVTKNNKGVQRMKKIEPNKLLFFTAPYCKNAANRNVFIKELQNAYPEVLSFIDLFDNNNDYYADCGHLNITGAQKFTERITKELLIK